MKLATHGITFFLFLKIILPQNIYKLLSSALPIAIKKRRPLH